MKQNKFDCIFYIVDDYIYFYNFKTNKLSNNKYKNYIRDGRIIKPKIMIKLINEYLKKEKITRLLSSLNTFIIYDSHLTYIDKKNIIDVFENCNFRNIKLIDVKNLLNRNKCYIEVNNNYLINYYHNNYEYIQFNKYIKIRNIIRQLSKSSDGDIYLFGINKNIPDLANIFSQAYYIENYNTYIIDKIYNKNSKQN